MSTDDWPETFPRSDVVLVVPPFAPTFQANLACHLLQSRARSRGIDVTVVYGNLLFASLLGHRSYERLLEKRLGLEYVFKCAAFGSTEPHAARATCADLGLMDAASVVDTWLGRMEGILRTIGPAVVGATCSFEQITSSVAILDLCKEIDPGIVTVIGGANCEDEMAEGILSLRARIDYVAAGESEETFPRWVERVLQDGRYPARVIRGTPCHSLDDLPLPEFQEFFDQYDRYLGDDERSGSRAVPYESSRGCWWGQRHHCTFCGLNGLTMAFREKAPDRVVDDLTALFATYPVTRVNFVDNIMPIRYFSTLLPKLAQRLPASATLFYEQKSNISFRKAASLKAAHVTAIQPGIESLNSHILECMDKGVTAHQNLALLRYARSLDLRVSWNLLAGFPGDRPEDYEQMADLWPHIVHLEPPDGFGMVRIDRFSPYFDYPERYGITNLRPKPAYFDIFPEWTRHDQLAYYFDGDYDCGAFHCREVIESLQRQTMEWRERWALSPKPTLAVVQLLADEYVVVDTREHGAPPRFDIVNEAEAAVLLLGTSLDQPGFVGWAIERHFLFEMDDRFVPLATATPAVMAHFDNRMKANGVSAAMSPLVPAPGAASGSR